ncbi:MAG: hypothetical protein VX230_05190 [Candidatus Thermoplasmatota archaeon]|nr:hypothetical protein [Candidatus Thermoplasmatota archaeon]
MQPEQTAPAPAIQPAPVAVPAAVPTAPLAAGPAPDRTMMIHTGLVLAALLLALLGVMGDAWSVEETSTTTDAFGVEITMTTESKVGLDDMSATVCTNGECVSMSDDLSDAYDNCTSLASDLELNSSATEEMCGTTGDMASAGFTGMLFISLGILALITTLVATFMGTRGTTLPFSQYYPCVGSGLILIGVVAWYLMMPEPPEGSDPSLGSSAWMTIVSIFLAAGAGGYAMYTGPSAPSSTGNTSAPGSSGREPGIGARTLTSDSEAREFVLRETAQGNQTLSIVEDGHLFRLTRATRSEEGTHSEDLFMTRLDALLGFTHERFDWLDNTRYLWNVMAIAGLVLTYMAYDDISLIFYTNWFILLFAVGTIFSMMQFADPELITFETNTGKHRTLIYRAGSNRVLTNTSMDLIDAVMRDTLRGEPIDPTALNAVAESIEAELAEARRAAEEAAAAQQAAQLQAQAMAQAQAEMQAQAQAQALAHAQAQAQAQAEMQAQQVAAIPPSPAVSPAAPPPAAAAPPPVAPAPAAVPPVMNPPPAPAAPAPAPAPPPVAAPPPSPMPPPAGAANPLPPVAMAPDMGMPTEVITPAPEIPMQAAPRDDSLSEGEKENILTDLGED